MNSLSRYQRSRSAAITSFAGRVVTSTGGAVASTDCEGFTVTKTASKTGRYTVQLVDIRGQAVTALKLRGCMVSLIGPDDAALTTNKGVTGLVRAETVATNGQFFIQFVQSNAGNADTEVQDGASFDIIFWVKDSSVR
jgi:hypothetical protein